MKLNMQDLVVWSSTAHISNKIGIRWASIRFPSLISLALCQAEKDGWTDICAWKEGERKSPTSMLIIPNKEVAVVVSLSQQMLKSPNLTTMAPAEHPPPLFCEKFSSSFAAP